MNANVQFEKKNRSFNSDIQMQFANENDTQLDLLFKCEFLVFSPLVTIEICYSRFLVTSFVLVFTNLFSKLKLELRFKWSRSSVIFLFRSQILYAHIRCQQT